MRAIAIMMLAALTVGCASAPKGEMESPIEQLSGLDAKICNDKADLFSALAMSRDMKVAKRQAIANEMKARNISKLAKEERKLAISELYESTILVYAMPKASPATLHAMKYADCRNTVLDNQSINYGEIVSIKAGITRCQGNFEGKSMKEHQACVDGIVREHSQDAMLARVASSSSCRTTIGDNIKLHKKAITLARSGKKQPAISTLEQSMSNWKRIANGQLGCTSVEKAIAIDGILRASNDISVVTNL